MGLLLDFIKKKLTWHHVHKAMVMDIMLLKDYHDALMYIMLLKD